MERRVSQQVPYQLEVRQRTRLAVCGIAKLPVELLQIIFDAIEEMNPHHLNAVCAKWRAIVRAQPKYWLTLVIRRPLSSSALKDRIALSRGKVRRIKLYGVETKRFTRIACMLNQMVQGVEELYLYATDEHPSHLESVKLMDCYPCLLSLHGNGTSLPSSASRLYLQFPAISHLLQDLVLDNITNDVYYIPLLRKPSPCPHLRSLRTSKPPLSNILVHLLANHPLLQSLILNGAPMWDDDYALLRIPLPLPPTVLYLNHLRTLRLHLPSASHYEIKAALVAPQLDSLHLHSCNALHGWLNRLSLSPPKCLLNPSLSNSSLPFHMLSIPLTFAENLKRFAFISSKSFPRGLIDFIVACPMLVHLDLSHTSLVEEHITKLLRARRKAGCVPLESLVIQHLSATFV